MRVAIQGDISSVELVRREVGHLVAEDFQEESIGGGFETYKGSRDADEAAVGIAAAEAPRQARAPLDAALRFEMGTSQRWSQWSRDSAR
jgi:hypothetical protein